MSVLEERLPWLDQLTLVSGAADSPNGKACVMQAVAYVANEPWSDHPVCASKVITGFLIRWNDAMNDDDRQILKPYVPLIVGTRTTAVDEQTRAWLLTDWLARECAPAFLRLAGLTGQAELLEALAPLVSTDSARAAQPALDLARKDSAAARAAAWDAARAAARDAARAAARDAAWDAARDAARDAAGAAAWDAARAAAGAALRPTVELLQASALRLLDERMIAVGKS